MGKLMNMQEFREFMGRIGVEWECPEPTAVGHCFEVPALCVYFDNDGEYRSTKFHDNEELLG